MTIRKRDALGIALDIANTAVDLFAGDLVQSGLDHSPIDIVNDHPTGRADIAGGEHGQVARAAADIQDPIAGRQLQHVDRLAFPEMVNPETQQAVHKIVMTGH